MQLPLPTAGHATPPHPTTPRQAADEMACVAADLQETSVHVWLPSRRRGAAGAAAAASIIIIITIRRLTREYHAARDLAGSSSGTNSATSS
jgi:hypothetical protein